MLTVAIFASAGYMKLCNGPDCSMEWASGASLRWSLAKQNPVESGLYMRELLRDSDFVGTTGVHFGTLIVECGAPLALLATPKDQESTMLGLGCFPREYIYRDAERQLLAVRRRVSYVIGRLGVTAGPRTRQTTWRLPQGDPRLSRRSAPPPSPQQLDPRPGPSRACPCSLRDETRHGAKNA